MKSLQNCINILIVGLENQFCKIVAEELSERLQMHFTSCEGIVSYYVEERDLILQNIGLDYLKKKEKDAIKECANFSDCVLSIGYDLFKNNYKLFTNSAICYIKLKKELLSDIKNKITFSQRDEFLLSHCHVKIDLEKKDKRSACKKIIENLGDIL